MNLYEIIFLFVHYLYFLTYSSIPSFHLFSVTSVELLIQTFAQLFRAATVVQWIWQTAPLIQKKWWIVLLVPVQTPLVHHSVAPANY